MFSHLKKYILSSFTMLGVASIISLGLMFVAYLIPGVEVDGFWSAFWGAIILSILSIGITWL